MVRKDLRRMSRKNKTILADVVNITNIVNTAKYWQMLVDAVMQ
jgi:hypothetical protein